MKPFERLSTYSHFIKSAGLPTALKAFELKILGKYASGLCYNHPNYVIIEVTKRCNLRCTMCYQSSSTFKLEDNNLDMIFSDFKRIIDQLSGTRRLWLTGGECFLNVDLLKMITYASSKLHAYIGLNTNGTILTRELADKLVGSGLAQLNVSIDSPNEKTFRKIRNTSLDRITTNIKYLSSVAPNIRIGVTAVIMKDNLNELLDILKLSKEIGATEVVYQLLHHWNEHAEQRQVYNNVDLEQIEKDIKKKSEQLGINYIIGKIIDPQSFHCVRPFFECFIDYKGRFTPCCDAVNVPLTYSIFKQHFMRELNNPNFVKFRKDLLQMNYPKFCQCCHVVQYRNYLIERNK